MKCVVNFRINLTAALLFYMHLHIHTADTEKQRTQEKEGYFCVETVDRETKAMDMESENEISSTVE